MCIELKNFVIETIQFSIRELTNLTLPNITKKFKITINNNVKVITINSADVIDKLKIISDTKINLTTRPKILIISDKCQLLICNNDINKSLDYRMRNRGKYHLKNINSI